MNNAISPVVSAVLKYASMRGISNESAYALGYIESMLNSIANDIPELTEWLEEEYGYMCEKINKIDKFNKFKEA